MTPSGIEPATFRFVAQHLNHCATAVQSGGVAAYVMRFLLVYVYCTVQSSADVHHQINHNHVF